MNGSQKNCYRNMIGKLKSFLQTLMLRMVLSVHEKMLASKKEKFGD